METIDGDVLSVSVRSERRTGYVVCVSGLPTAVSRSGDEIGQSSSVVASHLPRLSGADPWRVAEPGPYRVFLPTGGVQAVLGLHP